MMGEKMKVSVFNWNWKREKQTDYILENSSHLMFLPQSKDAACFPAEEKS